MMPFAYNANAACIVITIFDLLVPLPGVQIRAVGDTDDGIGFTDGLGTGLHMEPFELESSKDLEVYADARHAVRTHRSATSWLNSSLKSGTDPVVKSSSTPGVRRIAEFGSDNMVQDLANNKPVVFNTGIAEEEVFKRGSGPDDQRPSSVVGHVGTSAHDQSRPNASVASRSNFESQDSWDGKTLAEVNVDSMEGLAQNEIVDVTESFAKMRTVDLMDGFVQNDIDEVTAARQRTHKPARNNGPRSHSFPGEAGKAEGIHTSQHASGKNRSHSVSLVQINSSTEDEDEDDLMEGVAKNESFTPGKKPADPQRSGSDGNADQEPIDIATTITRFLTSLGSSPSLPFFGLVISGFFLFTFFGFVYAELAAPDDGQTTYRRPRPVSDLQRGKPPLSPAVGGSRSPGGVYQHPAHVTGRPGDSSEASGYGSIDNYRPCGSDYSDAGSGIGATGRQSANRPVMLCADLTLPLCETWFGLPLDQLEAASHKVQADGKTASVPVLGLQQRPLLYANLMPNMLSMSVREGNGMLGFMKDAPGGVKHVLDRNSKLYGTFHSIGPLTYRLVCDDRESMRLVFDERSRQMLLISGEDGGTLACANRFSDSYRGDHRLEVRVVADMDPVLSLLCILGSMVLSQSGNSNF